MKSLRSCAWAERNIFLWLSLQPDGERALMPVHAHRQYRLAVAKARTLAAISRLAPARYGSLIDTEFMLFAISFFGEHHPVQQLARILIKPILLVRWVSGSYSENGGARDHTTKTVWPMRVYCQHNHSHRSLREMFVQRSLSVNGRAARGSKSGRGATLTSGVLYAQSMSTLQPK